ncbi:MAG: hypothetical protein QOK48_12 [Blastocatellia bacterium]|nr:hypothetical protein [Blastocatellia bacterium]
MASESPKWIALVLSLIAISISGLSWWESHRNRIINEDVNRPILVIDSFTYDKDAAEMGNDNHIWVVFNVTTKNIGKVTALLTKCNATVEIPPGSSCQILEQSDVLREATDIASIASGTTFTFGQNIACPSNAKNAIFHCHSK